MDYKFRVSATVIAVIALFMAGCGKNEESSINLVVSSIGVDGTTLGKMLTEQGEGFTIQGQRISFTPSSVKVSMGSLVVFAEWVRNKDNEIIGGGKEIGIPINRTVDLVGSGSISDLITESIVVQPDRFGDYIGAKLLMDDDILLSGTVKVKDTTYFIENVAIKFGVAGGNVVFPVPLNVSDTAINPTVRIIFDMESVANVSYKMTGAETGSWSVELDSTTVLLVSYPVIMPYVGTGTPKIEKYFLTIDNDATYALKLVLMADQNDQIIDAQINTIYKDGFGDEGYNPDALQPGGYEAPVIVNTGNSISIDIDEQFYSPKDGSLRWMATFENFQRQNHSGTLTYDNEQKAYSAELYETLTE